MLHRCNGRFASDLCIFSKPQNSGVSCYVIRNTNDRIFFLVYSVKKQCYKQLIVIYKSCSCKIGKSDISQIPGKVTCCPNRTNLMYLQDESDGDKSINSYLKILFHRYLWCLRSYSYMKRLVNSTALRTAKTSQSFGCSECSKVKGVGVHFHVFCHVYSRTQLLRLSACFSRWQNLHIKGSTFNLFLHGNL